LVPVNTLPRPAPALGKIMFVASVRALADSSRCLVVQHKLPAYTEVAGH